MTNYFTDYEALTEEQALGLIPEGEYPSWIREVEVKKTKAGASCIVLTVDVYDTNGRPHTITVWCALPHLLRHACASTGHLEDYDNKTLILEDHLKGQEVIAVVKTQEATEKYKARSVITDFKKKNDATLQDDIAF